MAPADQPIPKTIADEAARWFADRDSGLLADDAGLAAWLAADPRHARAFAEMEAVWSELGGVRPSAAVRASLSAPPVRSGRRRAQPAQATLRRVWRWAPAALAASALLVVIGALQDWPARLRADAVTATGERRTIELPDGSHVQLNTHSAIAVDYARDRRTVRLLSGEAAFSVAADQGRPFVVEAGGGSATALGTRFVVRDLGADTRVTVTEHRVRVSYPAARTASAEIGAGRSVVYGPSRGLRAPVQVDVADAEAWTEGVLVFENRPLAEVVAELGRYHSGYIHVVGAETQNRRVSGVFSVDDPVGALSRLQASLGLRSAALTDRLILIFP